MDAASNTVPRSPRAGVPTGARDARRALTAAGRIRLATSPSVPISSASGSNSYANARNVERRGQFSGVIVQRPNAIVTVRANQAATRLRNLQSRRSTDLRGRAPNRSAARCRPVDGKWQPLVAVRLLHQDRAVRIAAGYPVHAGRNPAPRAKPPRSSGFFPFQPTTAYTAHFPIRFERGTGPLSRVSVNSSSAEESDQDRRRGGKQPLDIIPLSHSWGAGLRYQDAGERTLAIPATVGAARFRSLQFGHRFPLGQVVVDRRRNRLGQVLFGTAAKVSRSSG